MRYFWQFLLVLYILGGGRHSQYLWYPGLVSSSVFEDHSWWGIGRAPNVVLRTEPRLPSCKQVPNPLAYLSNSCVAFL